MFRSHPRCSRRGHGASLFAGLLLLGWSAPAEAALEEVDLLAPGDALITLDSNTGLEWLDTTATVGLSIDDVLADAGGWASLGFRPATGAELCDLLSTYAFAPVDGSGNCPTGNQAATNNFDPVLFEKMEILIGLLGATVQPDGEIRRTDGCFNDELDPVDSVGRATLFHVTELVGTTQSSASVRNNAASSSFTSCGGQFMVRTGAPTGCAAPTPFVEHTLYGTLEGEPYEATLCYDAAQAPSGSGNNRLDYADYTLTLQVGTDLYTEDPSSFLSLFREGGFFEERLLAQSVGLGYADFQFRAPNGGVFGSGALPETLDGIYLDDSESWVGFVDGITNPRGLVSSTASTCVATCETSEPDSDGDGVPDAEDNCPDVPNPSQDDSDGNGIGNACDPNTDTDGDGIADRDDACPNTVLPESVPTQRLGVNRHADVDGDGLFETTPPPGGGQGPGREYTLEDTGGCTCEQIIELLELGEGHRKFGCSGGEMERWANGVSEYQATGELPPPADAGPLSCSAVPATPRSSVLIYAALGLLALRRRSKD